MKVTTTTVLSPDEAKAYILKGMGITSDIHNVSFRIETVERYSGMEGDPYPSYPHEVTSVIVTTEVK